MNRKWSEFLAAAGAEVHEGVVDHFGDPRAEMAATADSDVFTDLSEFGVLAIVGRDARPFLHSQLTCDVEGLTDDNASFGCYCTPKGRVLANFLLWHEADGFRMLLPRGLLAGIHNRLKKFVLRSNAAIEDRSAERVILGLSGSKAFEAVAELSGPLASDALGVVRRDGVTAIAVPGRRVIVVGPLERGAEIWRVLARSARPVGASCWRWLDIINGLPWIEPATQDRFVPQMVNLELIGAVHFQKGCYPGQEIVARMQYLGRPKRRLNLAHANINEAPPAGEALVADNADDQPAGNVLNAAPAPRGGVDLLAVVQTAITAESTVRCGSPTGPSLEFRPLPYAVP